MGFEPIDERLEGFLRDILSRVDDCTGTADDIDSHALEYRALDELGFFADKTEYLDGTASVKPTYAAMTYFERKEEHERAPQTKKDFGTKVASMAGAFTGAAVKQFAD